MALYGRVDGYSLLCTGGADWNWRTGQWRTKQNAQGWPLQDRTKMDKVTGVDIARLDSDRWPTVRCVWTGLLWNVMRLWSTLLCWHQQSNHCLICYSARTREQKLSMFLSSDHQHPFANVLSVNFESCIVWSIIVQSCDVHSCHIVRFIALPHVARIG